jgi:hypothetical protein
MAEAAAHRSQERRAMTMAVRETAIEATIGPKDHKRVRQNALLCNYPP